MQLTQKLLEERVVDTEVSKKEHIANLTKNLLMINPQGIIEDIVDPDYRTTPENIDLVANILYACVSAPGEMSNEEVRFGVTLIAISVLTFDIDNKSLIQFLSELLILEFEDEEDFQIDAAICAASITRGDITTGGKKKVILNTSSQFVKSAYQSAKSKQVDGRLGSIMISIWHELQHFIRAKNNHPYYRDYKLIEPITHDPILRSVYYDYCYKSSEEELDANAIAIDLADTAERRILQLGNSPAYLLISLSLLSSLKLHLQHATRYFSEAIRSINEYVNELNNLPENYFNNINNRKRLIYFFMYIQNGYIKTGGELDQNFIDTIWIFASLFIIEDYAGLRKLDLDLGEDRLKIYADVLKRNNAVTAQTYQKILDSGHL